VDAIHGSLFSPLFGIIPHYDSGVYNSAHGWMIAPQAREDEASEYMYVRRSLISRLRGP
jgi:hypothetical protein